MLADAAERAGLERQAALEVLVSRAYAEEVREGERFWQTQGISAVPAVIIDERYLISGGQPPEVFENAFRNIVRESLAAAERTD